MVQRLTWHSVEVQMRVRASLSPLILVLGLLFPQLQNSCLNESNYVFCDDNNPINGYWWNESWVPGLITYQTQFLILPDLFSGNAVFYAPGVMEATAEYRGLSLNNYLGGVALPTCAAIGRSVWLKRMDRSWEGPYLVVDCAKRGDLYGVAIVREESVEVDFKTALRWGMVKNTNPWKVLKWREEDVQVSMYPPQCIVYDPVKLKDWLESHLEYADRLEIITSIYEPPSIWRVGGEWITFPLYDQCREAQ